MAPLGVVFLTNRGNLTRATLHEAIRQRLAKEPGCDDVRVRPSRARPRTIEAVVGPDAFLGEVHPVDRATLAISFSYPRTVDHEYYVVEWSESERDLGGGWHQDETHPDLGACHLQLDYAGETVERSPVTFLDDHPLEVLETRLVQLRTLLPSIEWADGRPTIPDSWLSEHRA